MKNNKLHYLVRPRFYISAIYLLAMLFPKTVNLCIVFDGFKKPYICETTDIRRDMTFKEFYI